MANTKISQLTNGNPAATGDQIPINRAGANFSVTAESVAALANIPIIGTAGQGYFIGPGFTGGNLANALAAPLVIIGNEVIAVQFVLHEQWTIRHVTYAAAAAGAGGSTISLGIYSADRSTKLLEAIFDGTSTTPQSKTVNVTLAPGVYWYAWSASTPTTLTGYVIPNFGVTTGKVWSAGVDAGYVNNVVIKFGLAQNSAGNTPVAGTLPSALGTMSIDTNHPGQYVPAAVFEP